MEGSNSRTYPSLDKKKLQTHQLLGDSIESYGRNSLRPVNPLPRNTQTAPENQHGFRQRRTTMTALTMMQREWV